MKRTFFWLWALCAGAAFLPDRAAAAWYWPFGYDEDGTNQPPRLHRLLEKANDYIELAEDESLNGNGDKAIENYKLALAELDRVEEENPDRAETTEFAPLRNRRAACTAAIDTIRFAQINENERAVAVSNTTELQKKWNKKHGIKNPDDPADDADAPAKKEDAQKGADATATDKKSDKAPTDEAVQTRRAVRDAPESGVRRSAQQELPCGGFVAGGFAKGAAGRFERPAAPCGRAVGRRVEFRGATDVGTGHSEASEILSALLQSGVPASEDGRGRRVGA